MNLGQIGAQVEASAFNQAIPDIIAACKRSYEAQHVKLLAHEASARGLVWKAKSYQSSFEKCFRINCLDNLQFPAPPDGGWISQNNLYTRIDDLVRTTIVTRYISGAEALVDSIIGYANGAQLNITKVRRDNEFGYYSFHLYIPITVQIVDQQFNPYSTEIKVEIQVTTQLQDALYDLTHHFYEVRRMSGQPMDSDWKWDVSSSAFKAGYAGHTLHLIEGMFEDLIREERLRADG